MYKTQGLKNDIIYQFYFITLYDYEKGTNLEELTIILYDYEEKEMYLECEGIKLAIEQIEFTQLIQNIINDNERN
tara:strand:- start:158 stop:382 length:225 start_codon:yes stop_codon:yes gene_type:complete